MLLRFGAGSVEIVLAREMGRRNLARENAIQRDKNVYRRVPLGVPPHNRNTYMERFFQANRQEAPRNKKQAGVKERTNELFLIRQKSNYCLPQASISSGVYPYPPLFLPSSKPFDIQEERQSVGIGLQRTPFLRTRFPLFASF